MASNYEVRVMTRAELDLAVEWAAAEGWNPGLADADCFYATDPQGFLIGLLDGEPVGCISVVRYGADFGFLGFYIVRPAFRGKGHGFGIWQAGMAALGARTIGLDGVVAQQDNYSKSGFVLAHRNVRYGGTLAQLTAPTETIDLDQAGFARVLAYDTGFFAAPREKFLRCWLSQQREGKALIRDGQLRGYGVIRRCRSGWKIGPLFADDASSADTLFRALAQASAGDPIFLDVPEPNAAAVALAKRYGLTPQFETARMYRGAAPALPLDRTFGITTFELG